MALNYVRSVGGVGRKLELVLLANSQTLEVGDVIESITAGKVTLAVTTVPVLGVVDSLCDKNGYPLATSNPVAGTASGVDVRSKATSTDGTYYALVDTSQDSIYSGSITAALTASTTALRGAYFDADGTDFGMVSVASYSRDVSASAAGDSRHFYSWGQDPNDSSRLLVSIAYSELNTQIKTN